MPCGATCCSAAQTCDVGTCRAACAASSRCGTGLLETCCTAMQVCYLDSCTVPGPDCTGSSACPMGQYCDTALGKCLPLAPGNNLCEFRSDGGSFNPVSLWKYVVSTDVYTQVMMAPVVADVNGDKVPDVLANFFQGGAYGSPGVMRALSGDDGRVLWSTADVAADHIFPASSIAVADLDGSGKLVAVTVSATGRLIAFDGRTGARLWTSHDGTGAAVSCAANWGGPSIANLSGDAKAEVVCGLMAFDSTGLLLWSNGLGAGAVGPLSTVVDLNADGMPDVTDGTTAWKGDGTTFGWTGAGYAGFPAIGDFVAGGGAMGRDGLPEIAVVGAGKIALVNGLTGALYAPAVALPSFDTPTSMCLQGGSEAPGNGGPPTVADFDGDGAAEIGVADLDCYTVFEVVSDGAGGYRLAVKWTKKVQDHSSSVTGSSVFDFEGDGVAEVVYADEIATHVYRGTDGLEIFTRPHCSGTTYEYPLIVDVNGNGRADLIIPDNTYAAGGLGCSGSVTAGIQVFRDGLDRWVNTRPIWNQHTYHVTNVCDGVDWVCGGRGAAGNVYGRVPVSEPRNWAFTNTSDGGGAPLNNFRQNVQGEGLFNAPDLKALDLGVLDGCQGPLQLSVRVVNSGALGVLAGVKVAFYALGPPRALLGVGRTITTLLPGQSEVVSVSIALDGGTFANTQVVAVVDDDGSGAAAVSECHEDNNQAGPALVQCIN